MLDYKLSFFFDFGTATLIKFKRIKNNNYRNNTNVHIYIGYNKHV